MNLFYNPVMPQMEDYYGKGPFTFTYEDLHSAESTKYSQPVARPKSMITGEEDIDLTYGVNWEDNAAGTHEDGTGKLDYNFSDMTPEALVVAWLPTRALVPIERAPERASSG